MAAENTLLDRDEWKDIHKGFLSADKIKGWIREYFNVDEDMANFERKNEGYLELRSLDKFKGYVFVGGFQLNRNYEGRMRDAKEKDYFKKLIVREFVDHGNELAGFSWRAKNG